MLIDKESRCWIEDAVDNNFVPHEATLIKSIPLCFTNGEDKLYWPSVVDGAYSVKAGYKILVDDEQVRMWVHCFPPIRRAYGEVYGN